MDHESPIACSLSPEDYRARLNAMSRLGQLALLGAKDHADGAELWFRNTSTVREELSSVVEAESACCPFLALSVDVDEQELALTITAPPEALPVIRDLVESFQGEERVSP